MPRGSAPGPGIQVVGISLVRSSSESFTDLANRLGYRDSLGPLMNRARCGTCNPPLTGPTRHSLSLPPAGRPGSEAASSPRRMFCRRPSVAVLRPKGSRCDGCPIWSVSSEAQGEKWMHVRSATAPRVIVRRSPSQLTFCDDNFHSCLRPGPGQRPQAVTIAAFAAITFQC